MQSQFDAQRYLMECYQSPEQRAAPLKYCFSFFNRYHDKWNSSKRPSWRWRGGRTIPANRHRCSQKVVANMVHSDFEDSCNREVQLWIDRSPDAFNWTPVAEYTMKHCENATESAVDPHAVAEREEELR